MQHSCLLHEQDWHAAQVSVTWTRLTCNTAVCYMNKADMWHKCLLHEQSDMQHKCLWNEQGWHAVQVLHEQGWYATQALHEQGWHATQVLHEQGWHAVQVSNAFCPDKTVMVDCWTLKTNFQFSSVRWPANLFSVLLGKDKPVWVHWGVKMWSKKLPVLYK